MPALVLLKTGTMRWSFDIDIHMTISITSLVCRSFYVVCFSNPQKTNNMKTVFRPFAQKDYSSILAMIIKLYREDEGSHSVTAEKIQRTFSMLASEPQRGTIMVMEQDGKLIGYAILINFWSNEFGGNILAIDELFIESHYRSRGIASRFIDYLVQSRFAQAVALQLEVTPTNTRALKLYKRLGFVAHKNNTYDLLLK
tara:strand:- start:5 stop:598 length:594 start_codon:yes stop_codon:yes gene_type:complete